MVASFKHKHVLQPMNAPHSQKHLYCFQVQTKALEIHTGSLSAAGESYEVTLFGQCTLGVELEIRAVNRQGITAITQLKCGNRVGNSWSATVNFGLNVVPLGIDTNKSRLMQCGILANDKWGIAA